jgi:hypothetical protein
MCFLDAGLTLALQPESYWHGRYDQALELSPVYVMFLRTHPLAFVGSIAAWIACFSVTLLLVHWRVALGMSFGLVMSHGFGALCWLLDRVDGGPWLVFTVYCGGAGLLVLTWERAGVIRPMVGSAEPVRSPDRGDK